MMLRHQHTVLTHSHRNWQHSVKHPTMAMRVSNRRALASAVQLSRTSFVRRNEARSFTTSAVPHVVVSSQTPNMRHAQREPENPGGIRAPPINPADKYAAKADDMHRYGSWLMGCLPKYIQQFSVWKDELTIYIPPSGVIPVFSFLKCKRVISYATYQCADPL
jgi:NADH dehydrogenase (ubiquinone) Fe-S protein 3